MISSTGETISASFGKDSNGNYFELTVGGATISVSDNKRFYKSSYMGIVEQNYAKTASTTQNPSKFRTACDILTGTLNFYPKYTKNNLVSFTRIIYAMPLNSDGGFNASTNVTSLTQLMNRTTGATINSTTTIGTSAYVGYTLKGGKYRVKTRTDSSADWVNVRGWIDIPTSTPTVTEPYAYINSGTLTLQRGTTDCYFEIQLAPVTTKLYFMDGNTLVKPSYYDADSNYIASGGYHKIQYTEPLDFLYKKTDGSLYTDENGNYSWNFYLTDPSGEKIFDGWYLDGSLTELATADFRCRQTTEGTMWYLYAKWRPAKATISFDSMGGSAVPAQSVEIGQNSTEPTAPHKEGFRFVGWYTEDGTHFAFGGDVVADITLYAMWVPEHFAEYTVYHYLVEGSVTTELSQYREIGYGNVGDTVTAYALSTNTVTLGGVGYYIAADKNSPVSKSIELKENSSENTAAFYYNKQTDWPYTVFYLKRDGSPFLDDDGKPLNDSTGRSLQLFVDNNGDTLFDENGAPRLDEDGEPLFDPNDNPLVNSSGTFTGKYVNETDMLFVTELAPSIEGYAMINCNGSYRNGVNTYGVRGHGGIYTHLIPATDNYLYIYYDKLYTLSFDLQGGTADATYADRKLIYKETTKLPPAPTRAGYIFLNWSENEDGSGSTYFPNKSYIMPQKDITLYAQWAEATAGADVGRLLDIQSGGNRSVNIAQNGTVTAWFTLTAEHTGTIDLTKLNLRADNGFPKDTVITLITANGYYYYKLGSAAVSVPLTAFSEMGRTTKFSGGKVDSFMCQLCVEYPNQTGATALCISATEDFEAAARLDVTFSGIIVSPSGYAAAGSNTAAAGSLDTTVTISNLANLSANQSDSRQTQGTLANYAAVLAINLKDGDGNMVPFPENSTVTVGEETLKAAGNVVGVITKTVENGVYTVTASGLPTDRQLTVCFELCAADSEGGNDATHPERLTLDTKAVSLAYTPKPDYAVRAQLSNKLARVFAAPNEDKTLSFNVSYAPAGSAELPSVTAYVKSGDAYTPTGWTTSIEGSNGSASATVTIPANTDPGTYRLTFSIGTAEYHYNIIITPD